MSQKIRALQDQIEAAHQRIREHIRETPLEFSQYLSAQFDANVYLKLENVQHTGSFKFRGALNKVLSLSEDELKNGVVTASSGNHGMAVALAAKMANVQAKVFVANIASKAKVERVRQLGAEIQTVGENGLEAELAARDYSGKTGVPFISPYNDPDVVAGQGTIGVELAKQLGQIDGLFISIGGGGLISGIAGYLKSVIPQVRVIGCQPENSRVMYESVKAGRILEFPEQDTLSDGTAGGIEQNAVTFPLCEELIDEFALVSEQEIASAMRVVAAHDNWIIEGAAGVAVAALLKNNVKWRGKNIVVLICGKNISFETLQRVIA